MRKYHVIEEIGIKFVCGWCRVKVMLKPGLGWYRMIVLLQPGQEQQRGQGSTQQYFVKRNETECGCSHDKPNDPSEFVLQYKSTKSPL
jgi:hypothetical protein